jgi:hypothetical protein
MAGVTLCMTVSAAQRATSQDEQQRGVFQVSVFISLMCLILCRDPSLFLCGDSRWYAGTLHTGTVLFMP